MLGMSGSRALWWVFWGHFSRSRGIIEEYFDHLVKDGNAALARGLITLGSVTKLGVVCYIVRR